MFSAIKSVLFSISILQSNRAKKGRGSCGRDSGHAHIPHHYTAFPGEHAVSFPSWHFLGAACYSIQVCYVFPFLLKLLLPNYFGEQC